MLPSPDAPFSLAALWHALFWPMLRLLLGLAVGLLIANLLEALRWTRYLARLAAPLARTAHLREVAGASFSLAFVSPAAANGLLSDSHDAGEISGRELMLANLFNSLPAYLVHASIFSADLAGAGRARRDLCGAYPAGRRRAHRFYRAAVAPPAAAAPAGLSGLQGGRRHAHGLGRGAAQGLEAFSPPSAHCKLVYFTVPVYVLMYLLQIYGFFNLAEEWLAAHMGWLSFLKPQAMGIIVLHLAAELGAALGAAGSVLQTGAPSPRDVVLALMVGNILSTPMRAIRHQLPSYTGFFRPALALRLILANQGLRAFSMVLVTLLYYFS